MAAAESFRTAEMEETDRVMAHIRDLNQSVAERVLGDGVASSDERFRRAVVRWQALPFSLLDFHFSDEGFWRTRVLEPPVQQMAMERGGNDAQLARHLLSVAWHCGRASPGPRLLLGIAREVGDLIATLRYGQLEGVACAYVGDVTHRWKDVPGFWLELLEASQDYSEAQWSKFQVHALRLLGRESV